MLRRTGRFVLDQRNQGRNVEVLTIGKKGRDFLVRNGQRITAEVSKLGDYPHLVDILGLARVLTDGFLQEQYDEAYVIYSQFVNTLTQRPIVKQIIPIEQIGDNAKAHDFNYEPDQKDVLELSLIHI